TSVRSCATACTESVAGKRTSVAARAAEASREAGRMDILLDAKSPLLYRGAGRPGGRACGGACRTGTRACGAGSWIHSLWSPTLLGDDLAWHQQVLCCISSCRRDSLSRGEGHSHDTG